jgi:hypothetical protein
MGTGNQGTVVTTVAEISRSLRGFQTIGINGANQFMVQGQNG